MEGLGSTASRIQRSTALHRRCAAGREGWAAQRRACSAARPCIDDAAGRKGLGGTASRNAVQHGPASTTRRREGGVGSTASCMQCSVDMQCGTRRCWCKCVCVCVFRSRACWARRRPAECIGINTWPAPVPRSTSLAAEQLASPPRLARNALVRGVLCIVGPHQGAAESVGHVVHAQRQLGYDPQGSACKQRAEGEGTPRGRASPW